MLVADEELKSLDVDTLARLLAQEEKEVEAIEGDIKRLNAQKRIPLATGKNKGTMAMMAYGCGWVCVCGERGRLTEGVCDGA